jgi:hypothetical protein
MLGRSAYQGANMKIPKLGLPVFCLILSVLMNINVACASVFVDVRINNKINVKLPKNWVIISDNGLTTLNSVIESATVTTSTVRFQANLKNDKGQPITTAQIYEWNSKLNQRDISKWSEYEINQYDTDMHNQSQTQLAQLGGTVSNWYKTEKIQINGLSILVSKYRRLSQNPDGHFIVKVLRVYSGNNSFSFVISYHEEAPIPLNPLVEKIISTLQCLTCTK